ncbi:hypothetical protein DAPPUDRAFT_314509 [Daphnia pulex]|uniref:Moesin/ezrin/radixin homolog 1 n=1 Tax=Daphnia pulex TaxID=6669 RepID=E9G6D9_DAPPU|nr:hypothetical protein DAPPUDRAFT_314509 [Daphnia pulex]|eukprot:EFX84918.1 hypothetical protein DAPPUDRAFT_314509 [Daphnia pulex]
MDGTTNETGRGGSSPNLSKRTSKILVVRVQMLDDTITMFQIQAKAMGSVLFEQVCQQVNLLESDYFGLEYTSSENVKFWLDLEKPMNRQLELSLTDPLLRFAVKFYAPDPAQLEEEFTRYLFCMQIKQDLAQGTLQCNDKTAALIASYLVQAECGDYVAEDYPDHTYLSSYRFVPHQDPELERRIMDNHKKHIGQSPAEADLNLLETARRCELYGVKMHPAKDPEGVPLNLAVAHMGVLVFQNFAKINTFSWAKVRKLSFKRKKFLIKLHPEAHVRQTFRGIGGMGGMSLREEASADADSQNNTMSDVSSSFKASEAAALNVLFADSQHEQKKKLPARLSPPPHNNINNNIGNTSAKSSNGPVEGEMRRKRHPTEKAYYIAKELLMTERTYKKDLEVIDLWFRDELNKEEYMPEEVLTLLFNHVDPLYEHHTLLLKELEHRMAAWEGRTTTFTKGDVHRIGDLLLKITSKLELYNRYIEKHRLILEKLEQSFKRNKTFEQIYRDFETRKVCYLPLNTFLLRPLQRILHYQLIVERLLKHYEPNHIDYNDCTQSRMQMENIITNITHNIHATENFVKLVELQRDLVGIDNVVNPNRQFLREGCLQKLSRKGFQQRMFFLFSDVLLYTNRTSGPQLQFKVHGQLPLRGVMVEESEPKMGNQFCFTIYGGNRALLVAANSQEEKDKWLEDLVQAVQAARELSDDASRINYFSLKSCSSSEEVLDKTGAAEDSSVGTNGKERTQQQRSNTTVHVCWHRNTSISTRDHLLALENQLSGYLLRKFKNSNGWQKLWVVFTNFCLFFYKTFQDDFPLASLPLLGYSVTSPNERDHIQKEFVFKLQFKNHVYFFRAESEYTFNRWMEVISSATQHSGRLRLFSRKESETVSPRF